MTTNEKSTVHTDFQTKSEMARNPWERVRACDVDVYDWTDLCSENPKRTMAKLVVFLVLRIHHSCKVFIGIT